MSTKIKICGMMREEDIKAVNVAKPEYVGFVFVKGRRRYISPERALRLKKLLSANIKAVGVFIDESIDNICKIAKEGTIDVIQLHGSEDNAYIDKLSAESGLPIIKAIQIKDGSDDVRDELLSLCRECRADMILIDSGTGSGQTFDWRMLEGLDREYFLAGGLDPSNVEEAIEKLKPYAVDVSSGVETDGKKDSAKIEAFAEAVRRLR